MTIQLPISDIDTSDDDSPALPLMRNAEAVTSDIKTDESKEPFWQPRRPRKRTQTRRTFNVRLTTLFIVLILQCWLFYYIGRDIIPAVPNVPARIKNWWLKRHRLPRNGQGQILWDEIPSSDNLEYHKCSALGILCARLRVPLDWFNGTAEGEFAEIAIVKVPARVPVTNAQYNGAIFVNPGGPGGPGAEFVDILGHHLQHLVDTPGRGMFVKTMIGMEGPLGAYHDIIGFDPRGVGATRPGADCSNSPSAKLDWLIGVINEGLPGSSNAALGRLLSRHKAYGALCNSPNNVHNDIHPNDYMSTASVARDMLELASKEEALRKEKSATGFGAGFALLNKKVVGAVREERVRNSKGRIWYVKNLRGDRRASGEVPSDYKVSTSVKLNFWGLSYGSLLGATFASMFPNNVGKMVLDGVLEPSDYINHHWTGSVEDTDKALQAFYDHCAAAGPQQCALANNGSTAANVRERVQDVLAQLYHHPYWYQDFFGPRIVTYSAAKSAIFSALYSPAMFPVLAAELRSLEEQETRYDDDIYDSGRFPGPGWPDTFTLIRGARSKNHLPLDAGTVIECSDTDSMTDIEYPTWQRAARDLNNISPAGGPLLASLHLRCAGYESRAHRFSGPFGGNTSTPILWIGNTADPICPLKSAVNQARRFPGSAVLTHDTVGHCSLAAYSTCTTKYMRAYFRNATLPPPDTVCHPQVRPFDAPLPGQVVEGDSPQDTHRIQDTHRTQDMRRIQETRRIHEEVARYHHYKGLGFGMNPPKEQQWVKMDPVPRQEENGWTTGRPPVLERIDGGSYVEFHGDHREAPF